MIAPVEQIVIGIFALLGAVVTGIFSVYNTKITKKLNIIKTKTDNNARLSDENDLLNQIVPALERKDAALDKIAEILDNILRTQTLTSQQLKSIQLILENRCQALEVVKALQSLMDSKKVQSNLDLVKTKPQKTDAKQIIDEIVEKLSTDINKEQKGGDV